MTGEQFSDVFGNSAADALYSFISGLNDVERNGATATVILEEMGITEVRLSNAVKSLANSHEVLDGAISVANTAWTQNTALATEAGLRYGTLESRISMTENAADNLAAAIGEDLTPVVGFFVDTGRGMLEWFTGVVEDHPAVSAGLTAVAVAVGVIAVAVTAFALVTSPIVVTAIHSITAAMMATPIFLIITGVVALTAAVVAFVAVLSSQESEYDSWTRSTQAQYDELQNLNDEYERAVEQYGETSNEALALRYEVEQLTEEFEANKQTVEELCAETDKLVEEHNKIMDSYSTGIEEAKEYEQSNLALIKRLETLATQSVITADAHEEIETILAKLNQTIPDLNLNYETLMNSVNGNIDAIEELAKAEAKAKEETAILEEYWKAFGQKDALEKNRIALEKNIELEQEWLDNASLFSDAWFYNNTGKGWLGSWATDMDDLKSRLEEAQIAERENLELIEKGQKVYDERAARAAAIVSYEDAITSSLSSVQDELGGLIEKYDEAYEAARQSIDSQIGLFDKMKTETELSIADMNEAMQSQFDYLTTYTENLQKAAELGLDEGIISSLSDGSAESAGQLDAIIEKIEKLGSTSQEAKEFVDGFNEQFTKVQEAKDNFATTVADMETDFSTKMGEIEATLEKSIVKMNMETDAEEAAKKTLAAYTEAIKAGGANAVEEAEKAANKVAAAFGRAANFKLPTFDLTTDKGYATGTASAAPGLALVGEEGPELVNFGGGEVVYTAPETERIINSLGNRQFDTPIPDNVSDGGAESESIYTKRAVIENKISLDVNGTGNFNINSNDSKEYVVDIITEKLKPILISILSQEVFEEGKLAYEY
jgi:ribosomal protein S17E